MAEFGKKIYLKNSAGAQQTAKIYSTTGESQTPYFPLVVDNVQGYATLVSTSDSRATSGRVKHSNGNTYAIGTMGIVPYGSQLITSVGGGTFTVPAGVTKLRVTCVGGGASGYGYYKKRSSNQDTGSSSESESTLNMGAGGRTSFHTLYADGGYSQTAGGNAGQSNNYSGSQSSPGNKTVYAAGGGGMSLVDKNGTVRAYAGAGGASTVTFSAYGGGGSKWQYKYTAQATGGASGWSAVVVLGVSAGSTLSYTVGGGGSPTGTNATVFNVGSGGGGAILVEWGQGIQ